MHLGTSPAGSGDLYTMNTALPLYISMKPICLRPGRRRPSVLKLDRAEVIS
jgi:hypothetical protein